MMPPSIAGYYVVHGPDDVSQPRFDENACFKGSSRAMYMLEWHVRLTSSWPNGCPSSVRLSVEECHADQI